ncbi:multidrug efflux pump subunit AcrB [Methylobacterium sp. RAS18]|nr:multidrug efflux pump subunit AcrB [Methylobacterium sp. RAS18]
MSTVEARTTLLGYGFSGQGQNAAIAFVTLKDWKERGPDDGAEAVSSRANAMLGGLPDAIAMSLSPPPRPSRRSVIRAASPSACKTRRSRATPHSRPPVTSS